MDAKGLKSQPLGGFIPVGKQLVFGKTIDGHTRCVHYRSALDIIAIKFACCNKYYPCHSCHEECAGHQAQVWPKSHVEEYAILCGSCGTEHTIEHYMKNPTQCPSCNARFNPGCASHHHLYFEK